MLVKFTTQTSIKTIKTVLKSESRLPASQNPPSFLCPTNQPNMCAQLVLIADCKGHSSTLRQFAASAQFDGNVGSETSGGVSAVQRQQRLRAP